MELRRCRVCRRPSLLLWLIAVVTPEMSSGLVQVLQGSPKDSFVIFSSLEYLLLSVRAYVSFWTVPFCVYVLYSL
jgi:hypothetical protein